MAEALLTLRLDYADFIEEDREMVALLRRALELVPSGDSAIRARLEAFLAQEAFSSLPDPSRRAMVTRALAMARRVGDPVALASVLTSHSWIVAGPDSLSERLAVADELVDDRAQGRPALCRVRRAAGADSPRPSSSATSRPPTARWRRRTRRRGRRRRRWMVGWLDAARALLAGRLADAERAARRFREAAREAAIPPALAESAFVRLMSVIRIAQGRLTEHEPARRAMAQGVAALPPTFFVVRAHAARERDDRDGARRALADALSRGLLAIPRGPTWTITLILAADIVAWLEDRRTAARLLDLLTPFADLMTWQYGPVGRCVGLLDLLLGRRDDAERRLRAAVALCERMDARAFLAMARHDLGTLLLAITTSAAACSSQAARRGRRARHAPPHRTGGCGGPVATTSPGGLGPRPLCKSRFGGEREAPPVEARWACVLEEIRERPGIALVRSARTLRVDDRP